MGNHQNGLSYAYIGDVPWRGNIHGKLCIAILFPNDRRYPDVCEQYDITHCIQDEYLL